MEIKIIEYLCIRNEHLPDPLPHTDHNHVESSKQPKCLDSLFEKKVINF